jgi:hypothetical protein
MPDFEDFGREISKICQNLARTALSSRAKSGARILEAVPRGPESVGERVIELS